MRRSPSEILGLNFKKKTVYLNYNFPIQWSAIITPERILTSFRMQCVNTMRLIHVIHFLASLWLILLASYKEKSTAGILINVPIKAWLLWKHDLLC